MVSLTFHRAFYSKSPAENNVEVHPGMALVGRRDDIFLRVVALESDIHKRRKVRCACMDYNAIYSFDPDELFSLPAEYSPKEVPVNVFLARFRGTHYVYKNKFKEVNDAMCQPNKDEGLVAFVTCAVYGAAPSELVVASAGVR
ncbi:unnamed protein product [Strongylus vulgaris]|uniref:Uncharacterized protein n=1 Tax=Strongylus vulgaris TaxID=40348 RepID=A0A3P7J7K4_STRVU|nr:unnamed protein product [Strongylus vulgaris]